MYRLSFVIETITRLLLPARSRKNIRQELQGICKGVETLEEKTMKRPGGEDVRPLYVRAKE
jgi:phage-related protein